MLSVKHQKFAERVAAGDTPPKAYKAAYPKASAVSVDSLSSKLTKNLKVKEEIVRLRHRIQESAGGTVLSEIEKRQFLADVVRTPVGKIDKDHPLCQSYKVAADGTVKIKTVDKIRALIVDNDLAGQGAQAGADKAIMSLADRVAGIRNHRKLPS